MISIKIKVGKVEIEYEETPAVGSLGSYYYQCVNEDITVIDLVERLITKAATPPHKER